MFLLVRELTGNAAAAFVGGLLFAFAPYRLPQSSHLQVLSSQWMPFVLYGLHAVLRRRDALRPLAGATAALVAQNLSCGYYLLYFSPFAAAYVAVGSVADAAGWRDRRDVDRAGRRGAGRRGASSRRSCSRTYGSAASCSWRAR